MQQQQEGEFAADKKQEFVLAAVRAARARAQAIALELDEIGIALKHNMIDAEAAVTWLDFIGAVNFINVEPFTNKIEVSV